MKNVLIIPGVLLCSVAMLWGCNNDEPDASEKYLGQLSYTWNLEEARAGSVDVTGAFDGLSLTISKNRTFITAHPVAPIWPAEGTFTLSAVAPGDFDIVRDDGLQLDVTELTETNLEVKLQYHAANARTSSVGGQYTFRFIREGK